MRIAILTNADIGLYKFRKELVEHLCKENEVYIVLPDGEFIGKLTELGCKFVRFDFDRRGMDPTADVKQLKRYKKLLREIKPDAVLTYTIKPNIYGGMACKSLKIPYIANVTGLGTTIENGGLLGLLTTTLYRVGLKKASCVFFQNADNRKLFLDSGIVKGETRLIPGSGVNLEMHCPEPYPPGDDLKFLFVGRIMKDKGVEELLEAFENVHQRHPEVSVDIVGWCDEDKYLESLKSAEAKGFARYHGLQKDVHKFNAACCCAVLPSYHEGTANVMLEASATARPVITTRVAGCRETFDEDVTGFGCEAKSAKSLEDAIERFLALPYEKRREMGLKAREKMEREYDRNIVVSAYMEEIGKIRH